MTAYNSVVLLLWWFGGVARVATVKFVTRLKISFPTDFRISRYTWVEKFISQTLDGTNRAILAEKSFRWLILLNGKIFAIIPKTKAGIAQS